jgi:hypothetical protein
MDKASIEILLIDDHSYPRKKVARSISDQKISIVVKHVSLIEEGEEVFYRRRKISFVDSFFDVFNRHLVLNDVADASNDVDVRLVDADVANSSETSVKDVDAME